MLGWTQWCCFLLVLSYQLSALSFINIESLRQNFKNGFYGSTGATVSGSSGNVDVFEGGANTQNIYKKGQREYLLISHYKYGEASEQKNTNEGDIHLRYAQGMSEDWSWEAFTQAEFNEFRNLSLRTLVGAGLRGLLASGEKATLYLGFGTFYEDETIQKDANQANFRGNIYLSYRHYFREGMEFVSVLYYQPSYKTVVDYRIQGTAGLEVALSESLSMVNGITYAKDSRPPQGVKQVDVSYKIGFNLAY